MAKILRSNTTLALLILMFVCLNSGETQVIAAGKTWCVAKPSASRRDLLDNIAYSCDHVNCALIQAGGTCFEPQSFINHASVAMNLYYQRSGRNPWNCNFTNSGLIVLTDPSYDDCNYEFYLPKATTDQ